MLIGVNTGSNYGISYCQYTWKRGTDNELIDALVVLSASIGNLERSLSRLDELAY